MAHVRSFELRQPLAFRRAGLEHISCHMLRLDVSSPAIVLCARGPKSTAPAAFLSGIMSANIYLSSGLFPRWLFLDPRSMQHNGLTPFRAAKNAGIAHTFGAQVVVHKVGDQA